MSVGDRDAVLARAETEWEPEGRKPSIHGVTKELSHDISSGKLASRGRFADDQVCEERTWEVEVPGEQIGGLAVHIGARVAATGGGCDIVVSSTVQDLVAGSGLTFTDLGEHELKDVPGGWRLFAVES